MTARLRIGTRGSPLARVQTDLVCHALGRADPGLAEPGALEVVVIRTTGDRVAHRPLAELGGKGLFCKEIESALLDRRIDLAVHSMKDLPTWLPEGLVVAAMLPRADPRDVLIARAEPRGIAELPQGAAVGTVSLRRRAQLLARRPDLQMVTLRGNLDTRLRKLEEGEVDATLLARAGLDRLGRMPAGAVLLEPDEMLPAVGQGAVGIECRADDPIRTLLEAIDHAPTSLCVTAERAMLDVLDGSCHTPIGGYARLLPPGGSARDAEPGARDDAVLAHGRMLLRGLVVRPDGSQAHGTEQMAPAGDGERLGREVGQELRARAGPGFFG
jgi:hydroxymethylbilane synthase